MKRYCSLFLLLFSLVSLKSTARVAGMCTSADTSHLKITQSADYNHPAASMQEKKPRNEYTVILFRLGIEGKSILISYKANRYSVSVANRFTDIASANFTRTKYFIAFSDSLVLPPEFVSEVSAHAPPILC